MKHIRFDKEKNSLLKESRGVGFEDIILSISENKILDDMEHPNQDKYKGQRLLVVDIKGYIHIVPYVETEDEIFLKTIIPSRKMNKKFKR